jgi:hypothetical protein
VLVDVYIFRIYTSDSNTSQSNSDPFVGIYSFNLLNFNLQQIIEIGYGKFNKLQLVDNRLVYLHFGHDESEVETTVYVYSIGL